MKKLAFLSVFAVALAAQASQQDSISLRLALKSNTEDNYSVTMKSVQDVEVPGQPMQITMDMDYLYKVKVGAVDEQKGQADAEFITSDIKLKMDGPMAMPTENMPKTMTATGKLSNRYQIKELKYKEQNMQMMMGSMGASNIMQFFIELPENPVKAGESWDVKIPPSTQLGNTKEIVLKGTYLGDGVEGGFSGRRVQLTGDVPLNVDLGKMMEEAAKSNPGADPSGGMMAGMKMLVVGSVKMNLTGLHEKESGKLLVGNMKMNVTAKVELPDMGMSIDTKGVSDIKILMKK